MDEMSDERLMDDASNTRMHDFAIEFGQNAMRLESYFDARRRYGIDVKSAEQLRTGFMECCDAFKEFYSEFSTGLKKHLNISKDLEDAVNISEFIASHAVNLKVMHSGILEYRGIPDIDEEGRLFSDMRRLPDISINAFEEPLRSNIFLQYRNFIQMNAGAKDIPGDYVPIRFEYDKDIFERISEMYVTAAVLFNQEMNSILLRGIYFMLQSGVNKFEESEAYYADSAKLDFSREDKRKDVYPLEPLTYIAADIAIEIDRQKGIDRAKEYLNRSLDSFSEMYRAQKFDSSRAYLDLADVLR